MTISDMTASAAPHDDVVLVLLPHEAEFPQLAAAFSADSSDRMRKVLVRPARKFERLDANAYAIDPSDKQHFVDLFRAIERDGARVGRILHLANCTETGAARGTNSDPLLDLGLEIDRELERGLHSLIALIQAKLTVDAGGALRCIFAFTGDGSRPSPQHEAAGGLAKAMTTVDHRLEIVTLRLDASDARTVARRAMEELGRPDHRNGGEVCYERGARFVRAIQLVEASASSAEPPAAGAEPPGELPLRQNGAYLITGGIGGLGMLFARYLAERFSARVLLSGRSAPGEASRARVSELEALGGQAWYARADVTDRASVERLISEFTAQAGRLNGIFHCAGIADRTGLAVAQRADIDRVLRPKVHGTLHLDFATRGIDLDVFVLFSSIAAVVGDFGAGSYAAANHFLDRFAEAREQLRRRGLRAGRTLSVNWPLWRDGGMQMAEEDKALYFGFSGMDALDTEQGLAAFEYALRREDPQLVVTTGDPSKIDRVLRPRHQAPPRSEQREPARAASTGGGSLKGKTQDYLRAILASATKSSAESIHPDRDLEEYGINSLLIMELNSILERDFQSLPRTLFFEYRSVAELADYFVARHESRLRAVLGEGDAPDHEAQRPTAAAPIEVERDAEAVRANHAEDSAVAVLGFGGRFPGANDPDAFWQILKNGVDCITEIPSERWDWRAYFDERPGTPGKSYCKWGGFIEDFDAFDPLFFRLPPRTAQSMDPQERLFLKVVWETLERANCTLERLNGARPGGGRSRGRRNKVGVFAGVMWGDYGKHGQDEWHKGNPVVASADYSSIANRVSYALDLQGPSIAMDTACSSSLVAIHLACESLRRGECDYAIAGGVSLSLHPAKYLQMSELKALSAEGKCRSFGAGGRGYVPGEGAGALLLKPLRQAVADGDYIHAVIRGTAVNHDGKTNGYTVPNPNAQSAVIADALASGRIDARTISYVEAHGTGTELGDPIEVAGLTQSYRQSTADERYCALGSAKSNIGHLEGAAGVTGVIKVLLQLEHEQIVPSLHSQSLNENIDFAHSPFWVPQALTPWERPRSADGAEVPRRAGVSSFGAGGTNAHVVLEEWENPPRPALPRERVLVPLSAKNEERLRAYAQSLASALRGTHGAGADRRDLARIGYTLQIGREAMDARLAIVADDAEGLLADLEGYASAGANGLSARARTSVVKAYERPAPSPADEETLRAAIASRDVNVLAKYWLDGHAIDWRALYPAPPHPISLPTYPFARDRFWIPVVPGPRVKAASVAALHPFLDANRSTLTETAFEKLFSKAERVVRDHVVAGRPTVPGVAFLEMARAAGELAGPGRVSAIHDAVWAQPADVAGDGYAVKILLKSDPRGVTYRIVSSQDAAKTHGHGRLVFGLDEPTQPAVSISAIRERCTRSIAGADFYGFFERLGIAYGPEFRAVEALVCNEREVLAELRLPDCAVDEQDEYGLSPSLLDGALQAIVHLGFDHEREARRLHLPFALGRLVLHQARTTTARYAHAAVSEETGSGRDRVVKYRIELLDREGAVLAELIDYSVRAVESDAGALTSRLYRPRWEEVPRSERAATLPARLLVLARNDETALAVVTELNRIRPTRLVLPGASFDAEMRGESNGSVGVVHLLRYGAASADLVDDGVRSVLRLVQSMTAGAGSREVRCLFVHGEGNGVADSYDEAVAGLGASLAATHRNVALITLGLERGRTPAELAAVLLDEMTASDTMGGSEVRYRAGARSVRALRPFEPGEGAPVLRQGGVYLITGGAGHLGAIFARHLAERHGARLVLSGRSPQDRRIEALLSDARRAGGDAVYVQADIRNASDARRLVAAAQERFGTIHGILHAAGRAPSPTSADADSFADVLGPKVDGTLNLDEASGHLASLEFFALFSSIAAVMGDFGAGSYAYANAFMDRFAILREQRRARGERHGKTVSINWPLWAGEGMGLPEGGEELYVRGAGMRPLGAELGLQLFARALAAQEPQILLAYGDAPERMRRVIERRNPRTAGTFAGALAEVKDTTGDEAMASAVEDYLKRQFAKVFNMGAADIDARARLEDYGLDSLMIVEVHELLDRDMEPLSRTLLFQLGTIRALADHLLKERGPELRRLLGATEHAPTPAPAESVRTEPAPVVASPDGAIAIVGISGRYPNAPDVESFWEVLRAGRDCIEEIPTERWEHTRYFDVEQGKPGKSYCNFGGFIDDIDKFDPLLFQIAPQQVATMDPQERLFLETAWSALENAGYGGRREQANPVGVFVGVMWDDYGLVGLEEAARGHHVPTGSDHASVANRVSHILNLSGPSLAVSTACSSSLLAVHLAVESLRRGECAMAIAGGVNLTIHPSKYVRLCSFHMLASDGRCRSFGANGKGYVPGEGVGAVLLKPLPSAVADGDTIYAVIRGSAVNHGGKTNGYTVPNPKAQAEVIGKALDRAGIDARTISYVEAHGTGTALGDPIEIQGLQQAFRRHTGDANYCAVGSVKSNIGHLESAAGIAALTKAVLQLHHRELVPSLHSDVLNPNIDFNRSPFYVQRTLCGWEQPEVTDGGVRVTYPRRAGVSSFGAGGTNVHVILEEHRDEIPTDRGSREPGLFVLSAQTEERLRAYAQRMLDFLAPAAPAVDAAADDPGLAQLEALVASHLGIQPREVDPRAGLGELGCNAVDLARLAEEIGRAFGVPAVLGWLTEHTTLIDVLARVRPAPASPEAPPRTPRASIQVEDLAYTLQVGREGLRVRLAFVASDVDAMVTQLRRYLEGRADFEGFVGQAAPRAGKNDSRHEEKANAARLRDRIEAGDLEAVGRLWANGADVDWSLLHAGRSRRRVPLPTYPFARERYWFNAPPGTGALYDASTPDVHKAVTELRGDAFYLADHQVNGRKVLPAAAILELVRAAGGRATGKPVRGLVDVVWQAPVTVDAASYPIEFRLGDGLEFEMAAANDATLVHARGRLELGSAADDEAAQFLDLDGIGKRCSTILEGEAAYRRLQERGVHHGPRMRALQKLRYNGDEALAELHLPEAHATSGFVLHPGLLDAALQAACGLVAADTSSGAWLPFAVGRITVHGALPVRLLAWVTRAGGTESGGTKTFHIALADASGRVLVDLRDFAVRATKDSSEVNAARRVYLEPVWRRQDVDAADGTPGSVLVLGGDGSDGGSVDACGRALDAFIAKHGAIPSVVLAFAPSGADPLEAMWNACRALQERRGERDVRVVFASRALGDGYPPQHAALAALARSVRREDPRLRCTTVALPEGASASERLELLRRECRIHADADEVCYRDGGRYVRVFEPVQPSPLVAARFREDAVYLITGGAGGLGLVFADYLARTYRSKIVLCGRSELSSPLEARLRALRAAGAEVAYVRADITRREDVTSLVREIRSRFGGIHGIIHAAGVLRDALFAKKTPADLAAVVAPKVTGSLLLDELTAEEPLDFFLLCSSIAAIYGSAGQADYAYANGYMDALAAWREGQRRAGRRRGISVSVNWPLWSEGTMRPDAEGAAWMERATGSVPLTTEEGCRALEDCLHMGRSQVAVFVGQPARIEASLKSERTAPAPHAGASANAGAAEALGLVTRVFAESLMLPASRVESDVSFEHYGVDSIAAVRLTRRLESYFGPLAKTLFFEYPTLGELADYFARNHADALRQLGETQSPRQTPRSVAAAPVAAAIDPATVAPPAERVDIAIVGLSGRYPMADDVAAFWSNLREGRDCVSEIPSERWDHESYFDPRPGVAGKSYTKWGGFIDRADAFDPLFFNIAPREAEEMDPQERVFLQIAWHALEDAGYARSALAVRDVGVFVGVMYAQYQLFSAEAAALGGFASAGSSFASIANRVSYFFDFRGPSIALDTMCSSSLTAIHLACTSLRSGESQMALAGGVNLSVHPLKYIQLSAGKFMSRDGRCRSFGAGGDGYVPGEGAGAVVLKRLDRAVADGDRIYGVIKGSALNHGGRTSGFTVPNPNAQAAAIVAALKDAGVDPATIGYLEAHGTGTALGDPIELAGLSKALGAVGPSIAIGSVKASVGHLESAAGICGLTKILLQMQHGELAPSLHADPPNPNIDFASSRFIVQRDRAPWSIPKDAAGQRIPRRAGLSSFGAGGANAHLIVEQYAAATPQRSDGRAHVLVLSARTREQLRVHVANMLDHLTANGALSLSDVAHTLQLGREAMDVRVALVVRRLDEAVDLLRAYLDETALPERLYEGSARDGHARQLTRGRAGEAFVRALLDDMDLERIAALWVNGGEVDWRHLNGDGRRIALPLYPFAQERYWFTAAAEYRPGAPAHPEAREHVARSHPLLGQNESTFVEQKFTARFSGKEPFLADHRIAGRSLLPGVAYLEMARAAVQYAAERAVVGLASVTWMEPLEVTDGPIDVTTRIEPNETGSSFRICSRDGGVVHVRGEVRLGQPPAAEALRVDLEAIKARCTESRPKEDCYSLLREYGFAYGPSFQAIETFFSNAHEALVALSVPERGFDALPEGLNPFLLDAALHAGLLCWRPEGALREIPAVPYHLQELTIVQPLPRRCWAHLRARTPRDDKAGVVLDVTLVDDHGAPLVAIRGFSCRQIVSTTDNATKRHRLLSFETGWQSVPLRRTPDDSNPGTVVVLSGHGGNSDRGRAFEAVAEGHGSRVVVLDELEAHGAIVQFWEPGESEGLDDLHRLFDLIRSLAETSPQAPIRLLLAVHGDATPASFDAAAAFCRSLRHVLPRLGAKLVHFREGDARRQAEALWAELTSMGEASRRGQPYFGEVRYRGDERAIRVVTRVPDSVEAEHVASLVRQQGVYLIAGGCGGLGYITAKHLASNYGARLVLTGRAPLDAKKERQLLELRELGGDAIYVSCAIEDSASMERGVRKAKEHFGALHGVIHAAGALDTRPLADKSWAEFRENLRSKVDGTIVLDRATAGEELDLFVLFSSTSALLGDFGSCDYATGNRYQVAYGEHRERLRSRGERHGLTLVIDWPLWKDGGMGAGSAAERQYLQLSGLDYLDSTTALTAFEGMVRARRSHVTVSYGDPARVTAAFAETESKASVALETTRAGVRTTNGARQTAGTLREWIVSALAEVLHLKPGVIKPSVNIAEYGFDSRSAAELASLLNARLGSKLPPVVFLEHTTVEEIEAHLTRSHGVAVPGDGGPSPVSQPPQTGPAFAQAAPRHPPSNGGIEHTRFAAPRRASREIAVIGVSGRYPKADDLRAFWRHLQEGDDCIGEVPGDRWDVGRYFDPRKGISGKTNSRWGGFLDGADRFDAAFFNLSPSQARLMDPMQRLFLECAYETIEDAAYTRAQLSREDSRVGVFVGASCQQYPMAIESDAMRGHALVNSHSTIANQVSYFLNLHGPCMAVDTACSSSLTAVHLACESLRDGRCDMAIAGGVNLLLVPEKYIGLSEVHLLASNGSSRPFGNGDGMVPGEGVGAVMLKPLDRARRDGDHIYGVIKATAVGHGGMSSGFAAPNLKAQADLFSQLLTEAEVDPRSISYIEAAANGSALGDPIEIKALTKAFHRFTSDDAFCSVGTVKSNIGHLEAASGISQLTKVLLQLQHGARVPTIHASPRNPNLEVEGTPFYLQEKLDGWERPTLGGRAIPRRAMVNSFGAGGGYATLLIEEHEPPIPATDELDGPEVFVLSAKDEASLGQMAERMHRFVQEPSDASLSDIAHTLRVGREAFPHRLAIVSRRRDELMAALDAYVRTGDVRAPVSFAGQASDEGETELVALDLADPEAVARAWARGATFEDTPPSDARATHRRIPLPTYPFSRRTFRVPRHERKGDASNGVNGAGHAVHAPVNGAGASNGASSLEACLRERMAAALGFGPEELSVDAPLPRFGLDSIAVANLRVALESDLSAPVPMELLSGARTISELAEQLHRQGCRLVRNDALSGLDDGMLVHLYASLHKEN